MTTVHQEKGRVSSGFLGQGSVREENHGQHARPVCVVGKDDAEGLVEISIEPFGRGIALRVSKGALRFEDTHVSVGDLHGLRDEGSLVVRMNTQWKSSVAEDVSEEAFCDLYRCLGPKGYPKRISSEAVNHHQEPFVSVCSHWQLAVEKVNEEYFPWMGCQDRLGETGVARLGSLAAAAVEAATDGASNELNHPSPIEAPTQIRTRRLNTSVAKLVVSDDEYHCPKGGGHDDSGSAALWW